MYYCFGCEEAFPEPHITTTRERLEHFGAPCWLEETESSCPHCGSDQIDDAKLCHACGEWKPDVKDGFCGSCAAAVLKRFYAAFSSAERIIVYEEAT